MAHPFKSVEMILTDSATNTAHKTKYFITKSPLSHSLAKLNHTSRELYAKNGGCTGWGRIVTLTLVQIHAIEAERDNLVHVELASELADRFRSSR